jgi:NTE family protein
MAELIRKPVLGLALGGGGARGLSHIGILRVFESEGISPDLLSGTSMGGIIAALYAAGLNARQIEDEARRFGKLTNMVKLFSDDLTKLNFVIGGESIQDYFREILGGDKQFSDLKIPLALGAVDVLSASEVSLQSGSLAEAVNATMALPGVAEPVCRDKMCLVDGGSLNNVPSDLARSMGAEVVIAVDVSPDVTDEKFWEEQHLPAIAAANWRTNAIMVANITAAKQRKAQTDIIIRPIIASKVTTLSGFKYADELIDAGSKAALEVLPQIRRLLKPRLYLKKAKISPAEIMNL